MIFELILLVVVVAVIVAIYKVPSCKDGYWTSRGVKLFRLSEFSPLWRRMTQKDHFLNLDQKAYKFLEDEKYGGYVEFLNPAFYLKDLDLIKHILVKDSEYFQERRVMDMSGLDPIISLPLSNLSGEKWKNSRKLLSGTFTASKVKMMYANFEDMSNQLVEALKSRIHSEEGINVNLSEYYKRYTADVIATSVFGMTCNSFLEEDPVVIKMAKDIQSMSFKKMVACFVFMMNKTLYKFLGFEMVDGKARNFFVDSIKHVIDSRRKENVKRNDFLQLMMDLQQECMDGDSAEDSVEKVKEEQEKLNDGASNSSPCGEVSLDFIIAQCVLFFLAGFDTVESLLLFSSYFLAKNPSVYENVSEEIESVFRDNDGKLTYESLHQMEYLEMVLLETLRMCPPGFMLERTCVKDYELPETNLVIEKDTLVHIPVYCIHHDKSYYKDPEVFDPERFNVENKSERHPQAFLPFGQGPRNCIGKRFAMLESKVALAVMVYNFKILACEKTPNFLDFDNTTVVLKPKDSMWVKLVPKTHK